MAQEGREEESGKPPRNRGVTFKVTAEVMALNMLGVVRERRREAGEEYHKVRPGWHSTRQRRSLATCERGEYRHEQGTGRARVLLSGGISVVEPVGDVDGRVELVVLVERPLHQLVVLRPRAVVLHQTGGKVGGQWERRLDVGRVVRAQWGLTSA